MTLMERGFEADDTLFSVECVAVRPESATARTFVFKRADGGRIPFSPGQFLNFAFDVNGCEESRSYSISSSAAHDHHFAITVKRVDGGVVSNWLVDSFRPGHTAAVSGPAGVFTSAPHPPSDLLLLSAGSGITPMASMMRTFVDHCVDAAPVFIHFARSPEDMIFQHDLAAWARALPRAKIIAVCTNPKPGSGWVGVSGRINGNLLKALVPDLERRTALSCGPRGFMATAKAACITAGMPEARFFEESFEGVVPEEILGPATTTFAINFQKSGKVIRGAPENTVLKAAQLAKVRIQTSCGKGICGTCRIKIVSGSVAMDHAGGIRQREIDQGFALACCSRPLSDLVIEK